MKRILVVEDDEETRKLYAMIFQRRGYLVECGSSEGDLFYPRAESVDVVILDLMLSQGDCLTYPSVAWHRTGIEFLRRLRLGEYEPFGLSRDVPVAVVTAVADDSDQSLVAALGVDKYLEKPFLVETLSRVVDSIFKK